MPANIWRCYSGFPGRDPFAESGFFQLISEFVTFVVSVGGLFTIDGDAFVPGRLSPLLGVLHLFASFGVEPGACFICNRCHLLSNSVTVDIHSDFGMRSQMLSVPKSGSMPSSVCCCYNCSPGCDLSAGTVVSSPESSLTFLARFLSRGFLLSHGPFRCQGTYVLCCGCSTCDLHHWAS